MRLFCLLILAQGLCSFGAGQQEAAEEAWKRTIQVNEKDFPALFNLGYFYFKQERFTEACDYLRRAAQEAPHDFNARYLLGASLARLGKSDEALVAWREALLIQPRNLRLMEVMAVEYSKGRYFADAAALVQRALTFESNDLNLYLMAIKALQDAGDDTEAEAIARQTAERFPESARANFEYGFHLQKEGKVAEALERLQKAMKADPSYEEPFFFYGNLLVDQQNNDEAIPYLRKAIEDRTDYVPARVMLARALMNLQKWKDAIEELEQAIQLDPRHPQPHLLLSQIYFRLGDEAKAKQEKEISFRLRRENPTILEAVQGRPFDK